VAFDILSWLFISLIGVVIVISGWMLLFEHRYIYFPDREILVTPASVGLEYQTVRPVTRDGVTLHGWHIPHPHARYTLLHFHGNAGNISHRLNLYARWHAMGLAVLAVDYRGYGKSGGKPDEHGLYEDARTSWRYLTGELGISTDRIIIAGRSLGSAVAVRLAGEVKAAGLVLETPFTSAPDLARKFYPWLPVAFLMRTRFDTLNGVRHMHLPLLIIRAREDDIVPAGMAEKIFSAAGEPKRLVVLAGDHNGFDSFSEREYAAAWTDWLATLSDAAATNMRDSRE